MKNTIARIVNRAILNVKTKIELNAYNREMYRRIAEPFRSSVRKEALENAYFTILESKKARGLEYGNDSYGQWLYEVKKVQERRAAVAYAARIYQYEGKFKPAARLAA